jgi:NAD(P)H-dependent FMN reductase
MISIFSGTNNPKGKSSIIAHHVKDYLDSNQKSCRIFDLVNIPEKLVSSNMYELENMDPKLIEIQQKYFLEADKFIFVIPEYNGSFPGVLKTFIDAISIKDYKKSFKHKKACLIGVAAGRAGNLRGLDHFSSILNFLGVTVMPNKLPISSIEKILVEDKLPEGSTRDTIDRLILEFIDY